MPIRPANRSHLSPVPRPSEPAVRQPSALPVQLTSFVGRADEIAAVCALVRRPDVRLVTLTGPGGVGKTRLAREVAADLETAFADGAVFVSLAPIRDPSLVVSTIAQATGVRDMGGRPVEQSLAAALHQRRMLLVLDNLEQVVAAATRLADLLAACPELTILATSRTVLRISGERVVPVSPLPVDSDAVRLFAERAEALRPDIALTEADHETVVEICRRLDGLPLAIELAAAWVTVLSPRALLARLNHRLVLLTGGAVEQPRRLQTMRDAIAWSYDLLDADERTLFRRLAIFSGGFTMEAAEHLGGAALRPQAAPPERSRALSVLEGIRSLVDKSLLTPTDGPDGESRFLMLETIREYGLEQLAASDEAEAVRRRHAAFFLSFAETVAGPTADVLLGPNPPLAIARLDAEIDNLRATLDWAEEHDEAEMLLRLLCALDVFWALSGRMGEARGWFDRALAAHDDVPPALRARALRGVAWVARDQGDYTTAEARARASLVLFQELGDLLGQAEMLHLLGLTADDRGDVEGAMALQHAVLDLLDPQLHPFWTTLALGCLGHLNRLRGDLALARRQLDEALARCRATNNRHVEIGILTELSAIALQRGEYAEAATLLVERLEHDWDARKRHGALDGLAGVALASGDHALAVRLFGAAEAARQRIGIVLTPKPRTEIEAKLMAARSALGESAFVRAWDEGRGLSPDEARTTAAQVARSAASLRDETPAAGTAAQAAMFGLTSREREVLALLAEGRSDREIADALFISPKTVGLHMTRILDKLGVPSRAAAVARVLRDGLV